MGLGDLVGAAASVWQVPDVDADRCVHSQLETATCRRCLLACPKQAWVMDDESLGIDMEACDGCGLCIPVCPEGAVLPDFSPEVRTWRGGTMVLAACEYAVKEQGGGRLPCLHAIGLLDLLRFYRRGATRLVTATGDCVACSRRPAMSLDGRVADLNRLLVDRGLEKMTLVPIGSGQWRELRGLSDDSSQPGMSRRDFLRKAAATTVEQTMEKAISTAPGGEPITPPGRLLPREHPEQLAFFVPEIDTARCNGCDACFRVCPHQALAINGARDAYEIDADRCTACGLCADVCDQGALTITAWAVQEQYRVPLSSKRCKGCGADFHVPAEQSRESVLCPVCEKTGHFRNLFQVMS